jgi:hypothetical protein
MLGLEYNSVWKYDSVVEGLPSTYKALDLSPRTEGRKKLGQTRVAEV